MSVGAIAERTERPALVRFKRVAVEDKAASLAANRYVAKDVDYALITPPYSKDVHETKVTTWLTQMDADVKSQRINPEWAARYKEQYRLWTQGQEMPLNGTAIRGWGVISPAVQENLIRMNVLTVEDLAGMNDEGMRRVGMGGVDLKAKAKAWLATLNDRGPLTQRLAALETENAALQAIVAAQEESIAQLKRMVPGPAVVTAVQEPQITAQDLLTDDDEPAPRKRK
jgi:hypothetical protein